MKQKIRAEHKALGLDTPITRRDFVGSALIGAGAGLVAAAPPGLLAGEDNSVQQPGFTTLGPDWTGPGGTGDYARANGNTHEVVNTAHALRDDKLKQAISTAQDVDGIYDLVIVGGGFSGFGAAYAFKEKTGGKQKCLILDNHAMFGGEAKQNEFVVDGYRLYGPQGSNSFVVHTGKPSFPELWYKLDLPTEFEFEELSGTAKDIKFAPDSFGPMMKWPESASTGYFYGDGSNGKWVMDAQRTGFRDAPISGDFRRQLNDVLHNRIKPAGIGKNWERQFDSMTYHDFLVRNLNVSKEVLYNYIDPYFASAAFGASGDAISAYAAYKLQMPGTIGHLSKEQQDAYNNRSFYSFPGGNSTILRHLVKEILPEAITGDNSLTDVGYGDVNFEHLDKPGNPFRIRLDATAVNVRHTGNAGSTEHVAVTYIRDGETYRVRAKAVVMATGGWITRRIVSDMPQPVIEAYRQFHHTPMLTVNVALRNWKFMENLGISAARWFNSFSWYANLRRPMKIDGHSAPLDPSKPAVMTLYVPFVRYSGKPLQVQASLGRTELLAKSYREYELDIRRQLVALFGDHGFDPKRDIAGIVLNRWGHAYIAPQPGFYFGTGGEPAPKDIVDAGYGRIAFGHSEVTGFQGWISGYIQGNRAVEKILRFAVA